MVFGDIKKNYNLSFISHLIKNLFTVFKLQLSQKKSGLSQQKSGLPNKIPDSHKKNLDFFI